MMLAAILFLALVVRLGWGLSRPTSDAALNQLPDQHDYLSLARSVLRGDGFVFQDPRFAGELKAFRTPGYPVFLAMCGANARVTRIVQAFIDTSSVLAIYFIAKRLLTTSSSPGIPGEGWGGGSSESAEMHRSQETPSLTLPRRTEGGKILNSLIAPSELAALTAAVIVAVNPFLVYFSGLLLTETLFTAMLAWAMLLMIYAARSSRFSRLQWLAAGLLLTTSILVRPSGIALPMMLAITSVFLSRKNLPADGSYTKKSIAAGGAMLLLTLLTLLPWVIRNHGVLGRWIPLDTNSGFTLYDGFNPGATGASNQRFVQRMPQLQAMDELQRSDYLVRSAKQYVVDHPGRVVFLALAKLARTWSPITLSSEFGQLRYQIVAAAFAIPFDLLIIAGFFSRELSRETKAFLLTPAIYFSIVHALTVGSLRYRIPAEPPLAILAGAALVSAVSKMRARSTLTTQTPPATC